MKDNARGGEKPMIAEIRVPNPETAAAMREARTGGLPSFDTVSDLMADLNAKD